MNLFYEYYQYSNHVEEYSTNYRNDRKRRLRKQSVNVKKPKTTVNDRKNTGRPPSGGNTVLCEGSKAVVKIKNRYGNTRDHNMAKNDQCTQ